MGYRLQAIIAHRNILMPAPPWIADSSVIPLQQNMAMIPMTELLHDQFMSEHTVGEANPFSLFMLLSLSVADRLEQLSQRGAVAYVEADFFGGTGYQQAIVWQDGKVVFGPIETKGRGAINEALQMLGVHRRILADEFAVIGLSLHRSNEDWLGLPDELDEED